MRGADGHDGCRRSAGGDVLTAWADGLGRRPRVGPGRGLLRFAFYRRVSRFAALAEGAREAYGLGPVTL